MAYEPKRMTPTTPHNPVNDFDEDEREGPLADGDVAGVPADTADDPEFASGRTPRAPWFKKLPTLTGTCIGTDTGRLKVGDGEKGTEGDEREKRG